jgi:molecular chaperone HscB
VASGLAFCETCQAVQPPGQADHFARLGLARAFALDAAELEQHYLALQRRLHPDRFAARGAPERALSMQQATSLNEAYQTLRSPLRRAEYLLALAGVAAAEDDAEVLLEALEDREALAAAGDDGVGVLAADVARRREACIVALGEAFAAERMEQAGGLVGRLAYLDKLASEARQRRVALSGSA